MAVERRPVSFRFPIGFMQLLDAIKAETDFSYTTIIMLAVREFAERRGIKERAHDE